MLKASEARRNYLLSEQNYHTTKNFSKHLLAIEMKEKKQTKIFTNKPAYLGLSVLEISKIFGMIIMLNRNME